MADLDARKSRSQFAKRFEDFGALEQPQNVGKSLKKKTLFTSHHMKLATGKTDGGASWICC
jgi:hypothetical protein